MNRDQIRALREAAEAGTATYFDFGHAFADDYAWPKNAYSALGANEGDLDAAARLHEALVPEWQWEVDGFGGAPLWRGGMSVQVFDANKPARAWFIAILKVLEDGADK